jgi:hypothetical protein
MTRPLPRPALDDAADAMDLATCPKCGGALRFESDRLGYGQTIEQCEHVARCGHWRTLEKVRIPAHTAPPREVERESERVRRRSPIAADATREKRAYTLTSRRGELMSAILAVLPDREADALTPGQVASRCDRPRESVISRLFSLWQDGKIASKKVGPWHKAPRLYWRKAA